MEGTIIKGVGGFYYVHDRVSRVYECRAKGIFRNRGEKPLVGDEVEIDILDEEEQEGNIRRILPRRSELIRPAAANADQALLLFALKQPAPNTNLLDRYLVMLRKQNLPVVLVFNKADLTEDEEWQKMKETYRDAGCALKRISVQTDRGVEEIRALLRGKTTVLAGPSGVGKSSLLNRLHPEAGMETGTLSRKIARGRHTTRHSELFCVEENTFLMDTPGFTSLDIFADSVEELRDLVPEFLPFREECRFLDCVHIGEKECGVKDAVEEGRLSRSRYENYLQMAEEIRHRRKY